MAYPNNGGVAEDQLVSIVQRVERLREEITALNADVSEVYKEARGNGFDVRTLKALISERAKIAKDPAVYQENEALLELYRDAVTRGMDRATRVRVHEAPHTDHSSSRAKASEGETGTAANSVAPPDGLVSRESGGSGTATPNSSSEKTSCPQREPQGKQQRDTAGVTAGREPAPIPHPASSPPVTGGAADLPHPPAVSPNPIEPSESCVDPVSEGKGGAAIPVTASPGPIEPEIPTFLDRRNHG